MSHMNSITRPGAPLSRAATPLQKQVFLDNLSRTVGVAQDIVDLLGLDKSEPAE